MLTVVARQIDQQPRFINWKRGAILTPSFNVVGRTVSSINLFQLTFWMRE